MTPLPLRYASHGPGLPTAVAAPERTGEAFQVHVIAYERPQSLQRLLKSMLAAQYDGDAVDLADFLGLPVFGSLFAGSAVGVEWYNGIGRKSVTSSYDSCMDTY